MWLSHNVNVYQVFVPERLPRLAGTHPGLVEFYEAQLGDDEEATLGQRWFDLCSDHASAGVRGKPRSFAFNCRFH